MNPLRTKIFFFLFSLIFIGASLFIHQTFAQGVGTEETFGGVGGQEFAQAAGLGTQSITVIIAKIIRGVLGFLGVVALVLTIGGGVRWMTSAGDPAKIKKAQDLLKNALIGLVIVFASFSLTQFILNKLTDAVENTQTEEETELDYYNSDTGNPDSFVLRSINTDCSSLRNIQLQFLFSEELFPSSVQEEDGIVVAKEAGESVEGTFAVSGKRVTFTPSASCGEEYPNEHCFEGDTNYVVTLDQNIVKSLGKESLNCTLQYPCKKTFQTGTTIDVSEPSIEMTAPDNGSSVYINTSELLQAFTKDDSGVSSVDFYLEDDVFYSSGLDESSQGTVSLENYFSGIWQTDGFVGNNRYSLWARGFDCAGQEGDSAEIKVMMRASNCDNGVQDSQEPYFEEGKDCGGQGDYFCGACSSQPCTENSQCPSGVCEGGYCQDSQEDDVSGTGEKTEGSSCQEDIDCASGVCEEQVCVERPKINEVSPKDGASGNYVTILGTGFGNEPGFVVFLGDPENETDDVTHRASSDCARTWSDTQVVVSLQEGTTSGPIKLVDAQGNIDRTDDDRGPLIVDFVVNETVRPGICSVEPNTGAAGDFIKITGNNFGSTQGTGVYYIGSTQASQYLDWTNTSFKGMLPSLANKTYQTQVFVGPSENRQGSNKVEVTVSSEEQADPPVISFVRTGVSLCSQTQQVCVSNTDCLNETELCEPFEEAGPIGQYVSIYGSGFGSSVGTVHFQNQTTKEEALGDMDFPEICEKEYWKDDLIVVQVPEFYSGEDVISLGIHDLWMVRSQDGLTSNVVDFTVVKGNAGPSICAIDPSSGPVGTDVVILGERFGSQTGTTTFYQNQSVVPENWSDEKVLGTDEEPYQVPGDAQTGPVVLYTAVGQKSNSIDFQVGDCREDFSCETGTECCADGTCRAIGSCDEQTEVASHYAYYFSTGEIPVTPEVVVSCGDGIISPSPWEGYEGGTQVCVNAVVTASFSVAMNGATLNAENIIVEKCLQSDCQETEPVEIDVQNYPLVTEKKFTWGPKGGLFSANSLYRVTLRGGEQPGAIQSKEGVYLQEDYVWKFSTASSEDLCLVGGVLLTPETYTAKQQHQIIDYSAEPISEEYQCLVLDCISYTWVWSSQDASRASVYPSQEQACMAQATALQETDPGKPVVITSVLKEEGVSEQGALTIQFTDPKVADYWPDCSSACVNVSLKVAFTVAMSSSVTSNGSIRLYTCQDELCVDGLKEVKLQKSTYDADQYWLVVEPKEDLHPNTYYRVVLSGNVTSDSGVPLSSSGANYGKDFSWRFKTKNSDVTCAIDHIDIVPETAFLNFVGERQDFSAYPYGEPDDCSTSGQLLDSEDYTWSAWQAFDDPDTVENVSIVNLYNDGQILLSKKDLPSSCTSSCLHAGSVALLAVCGDGVTGVGEDCDDGNTKGADGCSENCLTEGLVACASADDKNCCGNGTVFKQGNASHLEGREECDDGNNIDGDGCSSVCLNEGSGNLSQTVTCGNEDISHSDLYGGEECDDGNIISGDGCSAVCLHEGTPPISLYEAICGNTLLEEDGGEECDDGNIISGDGCSSNCLNEGSSLAYGSICGNAGDAEYGEDCDDGNNTDGDGCSSKCLHEGSSYLYKEEDGGISVCADGIQGTGEECEIQTQSKQTAPYAISLITEEAPQEVDKTTHRAQSRIQAASGTITGEASITLSCSCASDYSCGNTQALGCGLSTSCCYERPKKEAFSPSIGETNLCRNTSVWVSFDQQMDEKFFSENIFLELTKLDGQPVTQSNCPGTYQFAFVSHNTSHDVFFVRLWHWVEKVAASLFGSEVYASEVSCLVPLEYEKEDTEQGTKVFLRYKDSLLAKGTYQIVVRGDANITDSTLEGVASISGVGLSKAQETSDFIVGTEICALYSVSVEDKGKEVINEFDDPSPGFFQTSGEIHTIVATAYTVKGGTIEEIQPIPGTYSWSWSGNEGEEIWGWTTSVSGEKDAVQVVNVNQPTTTATAIGKNGTEQIMAQARIMEDTIHATSTVGTIFDSSEKVTVYVCEHPWPEADKLPFADTENRSEDFSLEDPYTNFSFFYCRDYGNAQTQEDDLPDLHIVQSTDSPVDIFKEVLFLVEGTSDAIGVRVLPNAEYLSPEDWYVAQGFQGSPSASELDGHQAIKDGRTLYVSAANQDAGILYPNMYVISYNENAQEKTMEIVDQILQNWSFQANDDQITDINNCEETSGGVYLRDVNGEHISCQKDLDCIYSYQNGYPVPCDPQEQTNCSFGFCDAQKAKLTRDLKRLSDIRDMEQTLETYGEDHRHCSSTKEQACQTDTDCSGGESCVAEVPSLSSGSFLRSFSTSVWPSWSSVLANEVGQTLVKDPLNSFTSCQEGADSDYCWNGTKGIFSCAEGSHAYLFQSVGGEQYKLYTQLEYPNAKWAYAIDTDTADKNEIFVEYAGFSSPNGFYKNGVLCNGISVGTSSFCGDGILGPGEICEIGQTKSISCNEDTGTKIVACIDQNGICTYETEETSQAECILYACGNGVVEAENGEECDDGSLNGTYGFCGTGCLLSTAFSCGDGKLAGPEQCDQGSKNGQYESVYEKSCAFDCSFPGPTCGDKRANGPELCDGERETWSGKLCGAADNYDPCETNEDCSKSGICGYTGLSGGGADECLSSQICLGGDKEGEACSSGNPSVCGSEGICSSIQYPLERSRTCTNGCVWSDTGGYSWTPCVGGDQYCGNGILEGTEVCDDGNDENSDACTTSCQENVCGDGYLYIDHESCDLGAVCEGGTKDGLVCSDDGACPGGSCVGLNGTVCEPSYGKTCSYCDAFCRYTVVSGSYCGDNQIQSKNEFCDGSVLPKYCYRLEQTGGVSKDTAYPENRSVEHSCQTDEDCKDIDETSTYVCLSHVGVCNGGNGNLNDSSGKKAFYDFNGATCVFGLTGEDYVCGNQQIGTCVDSVCEGDCQSSCPFTFEQTPILAQTELAGSVPETHIELYSYQMGTPDTALLYLPACEVGTTITADVDMSEIEPPSVDIVFVTDLSGSMESSLGDSSRVEVAVEAISNSISDLFHEYATNGSQLRIATVSYTNFMNDGVDKDKDGTIESSDACVNATGGSTPLAWLDHALATSEKESEILFQMNYSASGALQYPAGVQTYMARTGGYTPTVAGFVCAAQQLETSSVDLRIVVLLSDGNPTIALNGSSCEGSSCISEIVSLRDTMVAEGIQIYTAALTTDTKLIGYMAHFSSDTCATDYEDASDCEPTNDIEYAYSASTAEELTQMYDQIITSILGLNVGFTTEVNGQTVVTSGSVRSGDNVELPFPQGFVCPQGESEWTIPLRVNFNGEGLVKIEDMNLTYCPER